MLSKYIACMKRFANGSKIFYPGHIWWKIPVSGQTRDILLKWFPNTVLQRNKEHTI